MSREPEQAHEAYQAGRPKRSGWRRFASRPGIRLGLVPVLSWTVAVIVGMLAGLLVALFAGAVAAGGIDKRSGWLRFGIRPPLAATVFVTVAVMGLVEEGGDLVLSLGFAGFFAIMLLIPGWGGSYT